MNRLRPIFLAFVVVASALLSYGVLTLPKAQPSEAEGFSAARVLDDIEVISKNHHSVAHPAERADVREYLVKRLEDIGGQVSLYKYDSLTGPENKHVSYTFDAVNIVADFLPAEVSSDTTWLMLVAHYDSRYSTPMPKDTVWSYGAADDGYGIGTALELVSQLLELREQWNHGIRVLYTDAEEVGMKGMKAAWENDRQLFDDVALLINIEARGSWGPALLFETSSGNEKLMELYSKARYPYTYSLTNVVYGMMPNFTDFTIVKDDIPGMNFSCIADVNIYHTDQDCLENVSVRTIQHYGEQILPVAVAFMTDDAYSERGCLKSDKDTVNFTIPLLGLFNADKTIYKVICVSIFVIFLLLLVFEGLRGRVKAAKVFKYSCMMLLSAIAIMAFGELIAYACASAAGAHFKPFGIVQGVTFDNIAMIISILLLLAGVLLIYTANRRAAVRSSSGSMRASAARTAASKYAYTVLYGALALLFILSALLLFALGENLMFMIPLAFASMAMILWHVTSLKLWLPVSIFLILLHAFSFLFALAMALTIGAFGVIAMLAFIDMMVLVPMADLYIMSKHKK